MFKLRIIILLCIIFHRAIIIIIVKPILHRALPELLQISITSLIFIYISRARPNNTTNKQYNLCLLEKFNTICQLERSTLNERNKLVSSCQHRNKTLLRSWQYPSHYPNSCISTGILLPSKSPDEWVEQLTKQHYSPQGQLWHYSPRRSTTGLRKFFS